MKRLHTVNINTPDHYRAIYYGPRRAQLQPIAPLAALLRAVIHGGIVLDVGCGYGQYFPALAGADAVDGLDFSPLPVAEARQQGYRVVYEMDFAPGITLPDAAYDGVFCAEVLEHMDDPLRLVDECRRVLKPGGWLLATTPYRDAIDIEEHLWAFDDDDLREMLGNFATVALFRYSNVPGDVYEHVAVWAVK